MTGRHLDDLPAVVFLRPTHYASRGGPNTLQTVTMSKSTVFIGGTNLLLKVLAKNQPFRGLLGDAYNFDHTTTRMLFPNGMPRDSYDYVATVPERSAEELQKRIRKQLGFAAHIETIETNVLFLKVVNPTQFSAKAVPGSSMEWFNQTQSLRGMASSWENGLRTPIIDQTGSTNRFNFADARPVPYTTNLSKVNDALLALFGLQLVPGRESVGMLVVEKVK
jgi:hypothetical protein